MLARLSAFAAAALIYTASAAMARAEPPAAPPIEAYGRLPHIEHVTLSPSGKRIAFVMSTEKGRTLLVAEGGKLIGRQDILEAPAKGNRPKKDAKVRRVAWADDDHLVIVTSKTEDIGYLDPDNALREFEQVGVLSLSAHKGFWVFANHTEMLGTVFGTYGFSVRNSHAYGYFAGQPIEDQKQILQRLDLFEVDLDKDQITHHVEGSGAPEVDRSWQLATDGSVIAYADYNRTTQSWRLYEAKHRDLLAQDKNRYDSASIDGLGRTPGTIIYDMPDEDGRSQYYETALVKGAPQTRLFEDKLVSELLFDRATGLLDGVAVESDYPEITFFDEKRQARWRGVEKAFPGVNVSLSSNDDNFDRLIVYIEGEGEPGSYWTVDMTTGKAAPFGEAYPDIPDKAVGATKVVDYKAADGLQLHGILTLPPGREPKDLPVIVLPHGGPHARDYLGFDWWAQALASRGYAVFQPNYRGSSGYGREFAQAGFGEWGRKMQTDISDGLKHLADQGIVDPKRACIVGGSYGGYAALAGVTLQHGFYRCAVSVAGVSDLRAMLSDEADKHQRESPEVRYWKDMMGAKRMGDRSLQDVSPADHADAADGPVLLIHGKDDTIVPIEQSRIMKRALERAGKPVEFVELDSEDHHLSREPTRIAMLKAAVAFVEQHNPPN